MRDRKRSEESIEIRYGILKSVFIHEMFDLRNPVEPMCGESISAIIRRSTIRCF